MRDKNSLIKTALVMSISVFALTACESMSVSDWFDDDATYAGDVKAPQNKVETSSPDSRSKTDEASSTLPVVPPPSQEILQTLPSGTQTATAQPQFTSSLAPASPAAATPNLASVPPRPQASELPSAADVNSTRQDLTADNQALQHTLKDPNDSLVNLVKVQDPAPTTTPEDVQVIAASTPVVPVSPPPVQYAPPTMIPPAVVPVAATVSVPSSSPSTPVPAIAKAPTPTDQNVSGVMLGLQPAGPGKYSLVQLQPEGGIGSFAMAGSVVPNQASQLDVAQYQILRRVASQYATQKGRIRLASYSNDPKSQDALKRATTVAAYLIDLGVPATAVRMRIDPTGDMLNNSPAALRTDIFLEVPAGIVH